MIDNVRVRFAPSPTGLMHLGGVRTALFNYLFAKKYQGTFIIRIEDTDLERNFDPGGLRILKDLAWLKLSWQEGPDVGGPHAPYLQSQRTALYQQKLEILKQKNSIYRCFCTEEELEKKRQRQITLKQPPRYDRACLALSEKDIEQRLIENKPFIWRFRISEPAVTIIDMARGSVNFNLHHFSDFPLTRNDGSFTFLFVNCVDDIEMLISHVVRGEDHLSNTANQVVLYHAFDAKPPVFWHVPIMCNKDGKKLSKRDFGFSLQDLQEAGFLSEAICNYLAIIGGSFEQEIMNLPELVNAISFTNMHHSGTIKYDVDKLTWVNHQWIKQYDAEEFFKLAVPFLHAQYPQSKRLDELLQKLLIKTVQPELSTLKDIGQTLHFYFENPHMTKQKLLEYIPQNLLEQMKAIIEEATAVVEHPELCCETIKKMAQQLSIPIKSVFLVFRLLLSGQAKGPGIKDMLYLLGPAESKKRILLALETT